MVDSMQVLGPLDHVLAIDALKSICRTCLSSGKLSNIEDTKLDGVHLHDIMKLPLLQLEANDNYPDKMCINCIETMYKLYHFLNKCRNTEQILKKILNNTEHPKQVQIPKIQFEELPEVKNESTESASELKSLSQLEDDLYEPIDLQIKLTECENKDCYSDEEDSKDNETLQNSKRKQVKLKSRLRMRKLTTAKLQEQVAAMLQGKKKRIYFLRKTDSKPDQNVNKETSYQCITCDSSFHSYEELKEHKQITKHTKAYKYKCEYCDKKLDTYCRLEEHVRTHTGEKPNECVECGKCFNFKTDLKRHMIVHMEVKPYICRYCSKGFTRKQYLVDHERKHTGETLLCPFCGRGFHSYSTLIYHEKVHKGPDGTVKDVIKDKLFKCHLCDKTLLTEHTLKEHIMLHGPKNFSCEICGKTYINNNRLQDHIKLTHQGLKFKCHICDKEYKHKTGLDVHMRMHSGENNYPCEECGKQFACKSSLYQHKRLHTGDTKYQCKQCLHISINKRNMETHMRTHTGEKPFACPYCGKLFSQKVNMTAHTKIHTGEKNHLCKVCNKGFYTGRALRKHATVHEKSGEIC